MRVTYLLICILLMAALFSLAAPAMATGEAFSLTGTVVDRYGNPVYGANVTLIDNAYKTICVKTTNENGNYDFVNVVSNTDTVTVRVNLTRDGKTYEIPAYYTRWYPAKGISLIEINETRFPNYPEPVYGYLYGAIQTGTGNVANFIDGIVYLESVDSEVKYYQFADRTDGKGSFMFYAPPGDYILYAQHWENGQAYESAHKAVNITPNSEVTDVLETRIVLPLNTPASNPDPATMPVHHQNKVSGKVTTIAGQPLAGATVTLLELADNKTAFIPMKGTDGQDVVATTDVNGNFSFSGVVPTTNDGKAIQAMKDVRVRVDYLNSSGQSISAPLYNPDVIFASGSGSQANNISLPVTVQLAGGGWVEVNSTPAGAAIYVDGQQLRDQYGKPLVTPATVYVDTGIHAIKLVKDGYADAAGMVTLEVSGQNSRYSADLVAADWVTGATVLPLVAAVVIGIVCLAGLYLFLFRKGD